MARHTAKSHKIRKVEILVIQIQILKKTIDVKKDPDIDRTAFKSRDKAVVVEVLKSKYSLPILLERHA